MLGKTEEVLKMKDNRGANVNTGPDDDPIPVEVRETQVTFWKLI